MYKWLLVFLLLLFLWHVREVFPPFIVGAIIAYLLHNPIQLLHTKFRVPAGLSVFLIYLGFLLGLFLAAKQFGPVLITQFTNLVAQRHDIVTQLVSQVSEAFHLDLDVTKTSNDVLYSIEQSAGKPEEIVHVGGLISKSLLSILVCAVSSIYFLIDGRRVGRFFLRFLAPEKRPTVVLLAEQMNVMLSKYVIGQVILILMMSTVAFMILTVFQIKHFTLLIAIVSGVFEIIPVLGPFIAMTIAAIIATAQHGFTTAIFVLLCYWVARLFEDYVFVPNTIGHAVELHPVAVIFAVLVGETMAGALGMLIAIPVAASIKVVLDFMYPADHVEEHHKPNPLAAFIARFTGDGKRQDDTDHSSPIASHPEITTPPAEKASWVASNPAQAAVEQMAREEADRGDRQELLELAKEKAKQNAASGREEKSSPASTDTKSGAQLRLGEHADHLADTHRSTGGTEKQSGQTATAASIQPAAAESKKQTSPKVGAEAAQSGSPSPAGETATTGSQKLAAESAKTVPSAAQSKKSASPNTAADADKADLPRPSTETTTTVSPQPAAESAKTASLKAAAEVAAADSTELVSAGNGDHVGKTPAPGGTGTKGTSPSSPASKDDSLDQSKNQSKKPDASKG